MHLVGAVGGEHLLGRHTVEVTDRRPQRCGLAIRIAVPRERADGVEVLSEPRRRWGERRLVGVQADLDPDLWRVVAGSARRSSRTGTGSALRLLTLGDDNGGGERWRMRFIA